MDDRSSFFLYELGLLKTTSFLFGEYLMNLVFFLLLQISSLVKDNHDLTMKYSETKNKLQDLSSKLKSDPMKENEREGILKGNLEDLNVRLDESTGLDVLSADLWCNKGENNHERDGIENDTIFQLYWSK